MKLSWTLVAYTVKKISLYLRKSSGSVFAGTFSPEFRKYTDEFYEQIVRKCTELYKRFRQKRCRNSFGRFRLLTEIPCTSSVYVSCIFTERSVNYRKVGYGNSPLINGCSVIIRKFSLSTRGKWSVNVRKYIKKFRQKRCRNSFTCFRLLTHARKSNVCTFLHVSNIKRTLIVTVSRYWLLVKSYEKHAIKQTINMTKRSCQAFNHIIIWDSSAEFFDTQVMTSQKFWLFD